MKAILTIILANLIALSLTAQQSDTLKPASIIKSATVYFEGAEIERELTAKLPKGRYILEVGNLPVSLDPERIQAISGDGIEIIAVTSHKYKRLTEQGRKEKIKLEQRIQALEDESNKIRSSVKALNMEEKLLLDNINLSKNDKGSTVSEIREGADFYRQRLNSIYAQELQSSFELRTIQDSLRSVYQYINKVVASMMQAQTSVYITVESAKSIDSKMGLRYFVTAAGWLPMYDFRVDNITKPLELVYNAQVFQSSGEDWKQVKLTFSSANPSISGTAPELQNWYINRPANRSSSAHSAGFGTLQGLLFDAENGEPLPFANITIKSNNQIIAGTTSDIDGNFTIKPIAVGHYQVEINYVGYEMVTTLVIIQKDQISKLSIGLNSGAELQEVEIMDYELPLIQKDNKSSKSKSQRNRSDRITETSSGASISSELMSQSAPEYVYLNSAEDDAPMDLSSTAITFEVDQLFTVPSNGKDLLIAIKKEAINANYVYLATPKLDQDVFLVARLPNWSDLQLLSGNSSIYYQGSFTGDSYINSTQTKDTLEISLGRDASITTQRIADKMVNDKRTIGSNVKQTVGWELTVRNNKSLPILIEIIDQYPLSEVKSIEVEQLGHGDAKLDKNTGRLTWFRKIPEGSSEKVNFSYGLKYPADQVRNY